ncbi:MAG: Crp/Fnr family transcriptional regulator [Candidatus Thiothrix moscowensis]|nr:Crp/Fnr family transcriptional regulator [Candidatus Thiothrix moscowensis]
MRFERINITAEWYLCHTWHMIRRGGNTVFADIPLFQNLPAEQFEHLLKLTQEIRHERNSVIINQGEYSNSLYIVLEGRLKVYVTDEEGRQTILSFLNKGDFFGELSLLDNEPRSASVMTVAKTRLLRLTQDAFHHFVETHPDTLLPMLRILASRLRALDDTIRSLSTLDVYGRVARVLLREAEEREKNQITPRLTHQEIAEMVGSSREMVSRILGDLRKGGYIRVENKQIYIERKLPTRW